MKRLHHFSGVYFFSYKHSTCSTYEVRLKHHNWALRIKKKSPLIQRVYKVRYNPVYQWMFPKLRFPLIQHWTLTHKHFISDINKIDYWFSYDLHFLLAHSVFTDKKLQWKSTHCVFKCNNCLPTVTRNHEIPGLQLCLQQAPYSYYGCWPWSSDVY